MLVTCENISRRFGPKLLFEGLSWTVVEGERIGFVGPNGSGKSTLFKILSAEDEPDSGRVARKKNIEIGLLPQEVDFSGAADVLTETMAAEQDACRLEDLIHQAEKDIETAEAPEEKERLAHRIGELHERFERVGGYDREARAKRILSGLGFREIDFRRPVIEFSGGWRMRVALARLLLTSPELLLLDEPTNHLDIPSLEWLEEWLKSYTGTFITISHDAWFLDKMVDKIAEISTRGITSYRGGYSDYLINKAENERRLISAANQQSKEIERTERFISRFRAKNTKAKQVQSKIKQLEKIERIETPDHLKKIGFAFPQPPRSGAKVIELFEVGKSYGENKVYDRIDFSLDRGDRVALLGPNGSGKSTMLKILAGELSIDTGERVLGYNVTLQYYSQITLETLTPSNSVYQELAAAAPGESQTRLRTLLGSFLFRGDDVLKQVSVLSGGEKSRLALAKILLHPANLLLLDEPTNHLDPYSIEALLEALEQYTGTICLISHDRMFINRIASKIVEVNYGNIDTYYGNYDDYHRLKTKGEQSIADTSPDGSSSAGGAEEDDAKTKKNEKERKREEAEKRNRNYRERSKITKKIDALEADIIKLEERLKEIYLIMSDPKAYRDQEGAIKIAEEKSQLEGELDQLNQSWEELTTQLSYIENDSDDD